MFPEWSVAYFVLLGLRFDAGCKVGMRHDVIHGCYLECGIATVPVLYEGRRFFIPRHVDARTVHSKKAVALISRAVGTEGVKVVEGLFDDCRAESCARRWQNADAETAVPPFPLL